MRGVDRCKKELRLCWHDASAARFLKPWARCRSGGSDLGRNRGAGAGLLTLAFGVPVGEVVGSPTPPTAFRDRQKSLLPADVGRVLDSCEL